MKTISEYLLSGMPIYRIFSKNRCSREAKDLSIVKELHNLLMTIPKVATMTLIKYHHDTWVANSFNLVAIPRLADCGIEFLNGSDDNLRIALKSLHKFIRIISTIHSSRLKRFIFRLSLSIKVMSVNNKHNLIHIIQLWHKLGSLERSQCLSGSCCMPYIAVIVGVLHTI